MIRNLTNVLNNIESSTKKNSFWGKFFSSIDNYNELDFSIHLAIFVQPYLDYIIEGKKTIESRFSKNKIAPYKKIRPGDMLLLKKSGSSIFGICYVENAWFYQLNQDSWSEIKETYGKLICVQDPNFWDQKKKAEFGTLIRITNAIEIKPINWIKHDRRGWVILQEKKTQKTLNSWILNI